jgi:DNA-binding SARP family transcriptional activator
MTTVQVNLLARQIGRSDAQPVSLPRRLLEILCFFALKRRAISREELAASIWPDLEKKAATNTLHVTIHRLKRRLGPGVLAYGRTGYALGPQVVFDLLELEQLAATIRGFHPLSREEAVALERGYAALSRPQRFGDLNEALAPLDDRCRRLGAELAERLAAHRMRSGETDEALALAETMLASDPCDEAAWEIVIRAHLSRSRHADAVRAFQRYSATLDRELGIPASEDLRKLLHGPFAQPEPAAQRTVFQGAL